MAVVRVDRADEGRALLDFSTWDRPGGEAGEAAEGVREGEMPPTWYPAPHASARLGAGSDGPPSSAHHPERHRSHRGGWLRAAVLGANDGIVSTARLVLGVAASEAVGELVSVGSQVGLGPMGAGSARIGGAPVLPATARVLLEGWAARGLTLVIGALFGAAS